jgi:2-polyprenyl-6-hydroxyphenyl methylase/3-demethylubiquinone-9 3-methyltransferase
MGTSRRIDNTLYDRAGDLWWNDDEPLAMLRYLNPARFGYFRRVLDELGIDSRGKRVLDVGCGGGLLAEEFARLGCRVTGIDPSAPSLETARAHAERSHLAIHYLLGRGEDLPCADASYDFVCCCDVLEHVDDPDRVIGEIARVLSPDGILLFDTINRTWLSNVLMIKLLQDWRLTRLAPPNLHDWSMFIRPRELRAMFTRHGLQSGEMIGLSPRGNPLPVLLPLFRFKRGATSFGELSRRIGMSITLTITRDLSNSYAGYALKPRSRPLHDSLHTSHVYPLGDG